MDGQASAVVWECTARLRATSQYPSGCQQHGFISKPKFPMPGLQGGRLAAGLCHAVGGAGGAPASSQDRLADEGAVALGGFARRVQVMSYEIALTGAGG